MPRLDLANTISLIIQVLRLLLIHSLVSEKITFPKVYCFHTFQRHLNENLFHGGHFAKCKILDSGNFVYLIAHTIRFPKMYSFHTFQRNLTKILTKTCFMAAIL